MNNSNPEQFMNGVVNRASKDDSFREKLISNPVRTLEKLNGRVLNIPEGKSIVFVDQTATNTVYINVPSTDPQENQELSDKQLEMIAGGWGGISSLLWRWTRPISLPYKWWLR